MNDLLKNIENQQTNKQIKTIEVKNRRGSEASPYKNNRHIDPYQTRKTFRGEWTGDMTFLI